MSDFRGVYPVVVTPFKENGEIDFNALAEHADWMIKEGVHGLIPNGSTGEYAAMTSGVWWTPQKAVYPWSPGLPRRLRTV